MFALCSAIGAGGCRDTLCRQVDARHGSDTKIRPRISQAELHHTTSSPYHSSLGGIYFHATHLLDEIHTSISRRCHLQIPPYGPQSNMTFSWLLQHYIICCSLASDSLLRPLHIIKWHKVTHHLISKLLQLVIHSSALNSSSPCLFTLILMNKSFVALQLTETHPVWEGSSSLM